MWMVRIVGGCVAVGLFAGYFAESSNPGLVSGGPRDKLASSFVDQALGAGFGLLAGLLVGPVLYGALMLLLSFARRR